MSNTTRTDTQSTPRRIGRVLVNHLGFLCGAKKEVIVTGVQDGIFELQDMALNRPALIGEPENFQAVMTGTFRVVESPLGTCSVGDFSSWTTPGIYRVVLPDTGEHSYQFAITDGAFGWLPGMFLRFIHAWRSGHFENCWRGPTNIDDARRSDTGAVVDVVGGWNDAGDTRKWMVHSNLPALALMDAHERLPWDYAEWERVDEGWSPWLLESRWGLEFILKMQDSETGMFFEDVGGGGNARKRPGLSWWYENHSGCYADNTDNRFTDNEADSGDERSLRVQYNPIVQFTSVAILARAARTFAPIDRAASQSYGEASVRGWKLGLAPDPTYYESPGVNFAGWTSVRSWRVIAALELHRAGNLPWVDVEQATGDLLENYDPKLGFWVNEAGGTEPYRGILHSAQPLIAISEIIRTAPEGAWRSKLTGVLRQCLDQYVFPLAALTPFAFVPYGVFRNDTTEDDLYRPWKDGCRYRFFMPENHPQRINHGLGGHWMSWAHALALAGNLLNDPKCLELAWRQLHWLIGANPFNSSVVSGVGYNNPMPHSRLLGTFPGGFCTGFIGSAGDQPQLDLEGDAQWNTTEYWMTVVSNSLMALSILNPTRTPASQKLGRRDRTGKL